MVYTSFEGFIGALTICIEDIINVILLLAVDETRDREGQYLTDDHTDYSPLKYRVLFLKDILK